MVSSSCSTLISLVLFIAAISKAFAFVAVPIGQRSGLFLSRYLPTPSLQEGATILKGWVQDGNGEWEWKEDGGGSGSTTATTSSATASKVEEFFLSAPSVDSVATPKLPAGTFRPKQSLGQNFLRDGNTVVKIVKAYQKDAMETMTRGDSNMRAIELGPGAGALTDVLVNTYDADTFTCIEIDPRSVELLGEKHPSLEVRLQDVLQVDYPELALEKGGPLSVIGNLPYYITSQILFALADASHFDAVRSATVTMQWEVAQRIVAPTKCKDYGILSVVFQLYATCKVHFKIPPTVFYPQPKVDSALVGLRFVGPTILRQRLAGVHPAHIRRVLAATFQQRRKTVRNGLKKLALEVCEGDKDRATALLDSPPLPLPDSIVRAQESGNDPFLNTQELPLNWSSKRAEELSPGQFVELTRLFFGPHDGNQTSDLGKKVWRKLKHGSNEL
eukprot:scaffold3684_cov42-Attheya_sp.AAC.1